MQETFMRFVCVKRVSNVHNSINIRCFIHAGTFVEWLICMAYKDFYLPFGIFCAEPNCAQLFLCSNKTAFLYTYILQKKDEKRSKRKKTHEHTFTHTHMHSRAAMINVGINADSKAHHAHFMAETVRCNGRRQYFKQKKTHEKRTRLHFYA